MYNIGDRWIWQDKEGVIRGYIIYVSPTWINIKWENNAKSLYDCSMIKRETRLSYDKEYYRNEKLKQLGI